MVKWEEGLRRVVIEEAPSICTGKLVSALNRTMQTVRKDVIAKVDNRQRKGNLLIDIQNRERWKSHVLASY
jgi:hypothetical protein